MYLLLIDLKLVISTVLLRKEELVKEKLEEPHAETVICWKILDEEHRLKSAIYTPSRNGKDTGKRLFWEGIVEDNNYCNEIWKFFGSSFFPESLDYGVLKT